jgi:hypothetical protein
LKREIEMLNFEIDHYETKVTSPGGTFSYYLNSFCEEDAIEIGNEYIKAHEGYKVVAIYRVEKARIC